MKAFKYKHLSFEDRCVIEEFLNLGFNFSKIANRIHKDRTTIAKEVKNHRFLRNSNSSLICPLTNKPPYVCNSCSKFDHCKKQKFTYDHSIAFNDYKKNLINSRSHLKITKEEIISINDIVAPLMKDKHHSVNHVFISHPELFSFSKSTFYKYVDLGILDVRNIHLPRKVRFKTKKEYDYHREKTNPKIKIGRFYSDFKDYLEIHPNASIVEMDTVIGTQGGKGGKCLLTLLFRQFNFLLIYLLPYKKSEYVTMVFNHLKDLLGPEEFSRLFEVILTDNGTEFSDPDSIEIDLNTGEKLVSVFYCDPSCSWQKGCIEKNHQLIRYIIPKGISMSFLTQEMCFKMASHINSTPRKSLNNVSPYEACLFFIGKENLNKLNIKKIDYDDVDLSSKLFK